MKKGFNKSNLKILRIFDQNDLGSVPRIFLSCLLVVLFLVWYFRNKEPEYIGISPPKPPSVERALPTFFAYSKLNLGYFASMLDPLRASPTTNHEHQPLNGHDLCRLMSSTKDPPPANQFTSYIYTLSPQ